MAITVSFFPKGIGQSHSFRQDCQFFSLFFLFYIEIHNRISYNKFNPKHKEANHGTS